MATKKQSKKSTKQNKGTKPAKSGAKTGKAFNARGEQVSVTIPDRDEDVTPAAPAPKTKKLPGGSTIERDASMDAPFGTPVDPKPAPAPAPAKRARKAKAAPAAPKPARERDPRLPAPGTVIKKLDRDGKVRCQCTIEEDGIRYGGELYRSLSTAGLAAAKDLGLNVKTLNGYVFWGISKPARAAAQRDPLGAIDKAWTRYLARASVQVADEHRSGVLTALRAHAKKIDELADALEA